MGGGGSDIFNLGNGLGFSNFEVLQACERVVQASIAHDTGLRRGGDPDTLVASSIKARQVLGWSPVHANLDDIIASAWAWHSRHPRGYLELG
jgi:UDP-glucose 4-epimerase